MPVVLLQGTNRGPSFNRRDHVFLKRKDDYLCVLCGALTSKLPLYPTPSGWMPEKFVKLTPQEKCLALRKV